MKYMKDPITGKDATQGEMGAISNLISDMTLLGAPDRDMEKAVRHSMVVIDAAKHKLDYKRSAVDNEISRLKKEWQIQVREDGTIKTGGASTIVSRAKNETTINKKQGTPKVNIKGKDWYDPDRPEGALIYKDADDLYYPDRKYNKTTRTYTAKPVSGKKITYSVDDPEAMEKYHPVNKKVNPKTGEVTYTNKDGSIEYKSRTRTQPSTQMADTDDAMKLVSAKRHPTELAYAEYANSMKALANKARKEAYVTKEIAYNKSAKETYRAEVASLNAKINNAEMNSIRERAALRKANVAIKEYKEANPNAKKDDIKKFSQRATTEARYDVSSVARRDRNIEITDREWEAIQAGAIGKTNLTKILNNTDTATLRQRAMPKSTTKLSSVKKDQMKRMRNSNYTLEEIAKRFGVSTSYVSEVLRGE